MILAETFDMTVVIFVVDKLNIWSKSASIAVYRLKCTRSLPSNHTSDDFNDECELLYAIWLGHCLTCSLLIFSVSLSHFPRSCFTLLMWEGSESTSVLVFKVLSMFECRSIQFCRCEWLRFCINFIDTKSGGSFMVIARGQKTFRWLLQCVSMII